MEIFETTNRNGVLCLKARGRQRCQIVSGQEIRPLAGRLQKVTVRILPEPQISSPLSNSLLLSLKQRKHAYRNDFDTLLKNYKYRRYHLAQYPHCSWVYDKNEASFYVKCIIKGLAGFYVEGKRRHDTLLVCYALIVAYRTFTKGSDSTFLLVCAELSVNSRGTVDNNENEFFPRKTETGTDILKNGKWKFDIKSELCSNFGILAEIYLLRHL